MTLFSEAAGRQVVSTGNAATVGKIKTFIVDPTSQRVVGLRLSKTPNAGTVLPWPSIHSFGADAVTIADEDLIVEPDPQLAALDVKQHSIIGKQVLTTEGRKVGSVVDVDFDPADGRVVSLVLGDHSIDGTTFIGVGSYAVIVKA
ncbi:MAG: PRC-barrel domain-containing protein [Nakamurella sp.]